LNKADLLEQKLKAGKSIKTAWPDYAGSNDFGEVSSFIQKSFLEQADNGTAKPREVFAYITTATDTNNVRKVFDAIEATITTAAATDAGLIM
jgi:hypothetical protein